MPALLMTILTACGAPPDAALFARAVAEDVDSDEAIDACEAIGAPATRDECLATVVRNHAGLAGEACALVADARWAGECWFTVAERAPDRWQGLEACGHAGPFYDECLYHRWTAELSGVARAAPSAAAAVEPAREIVAFWSGLQTIEGDPAAQLWGDLWFFAHNEHRPADLAACAAFQGEDRDRCEAGTRTFVLRALLGELLAPGRPADLLDRVCRSGEIPPIWTEGLVVAHPDLDAQVHTAAGLACRAAAGEPVRRWNPVFRLRRAPAP